MCNYNFALRTQARLLTYMDFLSRDASLVSGSQGDLKSFFWQSSMVEHHSQPSTGTLQYFRAFVTARGLEEKLHRTGMLAQLIKGTRTRTLCTPASWGRRWDGPSWLGDKRPFREGDSNPPLLPESPRS